MSLSIYKPVKSDIDIVLEADSTPLYQKEKSQFCRYCSRAWPKRCVAYLNNKECKTDGSCPYSNRNRNDVEHNKELLHILEYSEIEL